MHSRSLAFLENEKGQGFAAWTGELTPTRSLALFFFPGDLTRRVNAFQSEMRGKDGIRNGMGHPSPIYSTHSNRLYSYSPNEDGKSPEFWLSNPAPRSLNKVGPKQITHARLCRELRKGGQNILPKQAPHVPMTDADKAKLIFIC